jgi:hypothetical protein
MVEYARRLRELSMRNDVEFTSEGRILRGWLYRPKGPAGVGPAVVKEQVLDRVADFFPPANVGPLLNSSAQYGIAV